MSPTYEVFALRYARADRRLGDVFLSGDPHEAPGEMDYFVWLIRGPGRTILVDTGFTPEMGAKRGRAMLKPVAECLTSMGVGSTDVQDVVITHLHYDHAGNLPLFPAARIHIQDREMAFATGRCMCHSRINYPFAVEDVCELVRRVYLGRVRFHDGEGEIAPGVTVHLVGGHSRGLMVVRVATKRGPVVLASDAAHYWANLIRREPFPIIDSMPDMMDGFDRLIALGGDTAHIVPGHDPMVRAAWPRVGDLDVWALHEQPLTLPS